MGFLHQLMAGSSCNSQHPPCSWCFRGAWSVMSVDRPLLTGLVCGHIVCVAPSSGASVSPCGSSSQVLVTCPVLHSTQSLPRG